MDNRWRSKCLVLSLQSRIRNRHICLHSCEGLAEISCRFEHFVPWQGQFLSFPFPQQILAFEQIHCGKLEELILSFRSSLTMHAFILAGLCISHSPSVLSAVCLCKLCFSQGTDSAQNNEPLNEANVSLLSHSWQEARNVFEIAEIDKKNILYVFLPF